MLNRMETLMIPYALYPLTNKQAVSNHTGLVGEDSSIAYKVVEAIETAATWIVRSYRRNSAIRELSRLDDHMLKDIGIHRGEIRYVVESRLDAPVARPVEPKPERTVRPAPRTELPVENNDNNERRFSAMI